MRKGAQFRPGAMRAGSRGLQAACRSYRWWRPPNCGMALIRPESDGLHRPWFRRILGQREVGPGIVIISGEQLHVPVQRSLVENDDMIETLSPDCADHPLNICSLPGRARSRKHFFDSHGLHLFDKLASEDTVSNRAGGNAVRYPRETLPAVAARSTLPSDEPSRRNAQFAVGRVREPQRRTESGTGESAR